nr:hypothetical protein Iba_chr15eCG4180 [Ipomoea batatas]
MQSTSSRIPLPKGKSGTLTTTRPACYHWTPPSSSSIAPGSLLVIGQRPLGEAPHLRVSSVIPFEEVAATMAQTLSYACKHKHRLFSGCQLYAMKPEEESQAFTSHDEGFGTTNLKSYRRAVAQLEESLKQFRTPISFAGTPCSFRLSSDRNTWSGSPTLCPSEEAVYLYSHMFPG